MKKFILIFTLMLLFISSAFAGSDLFNKRLYRNFWENHYRHYQNLGRNPFIQSPYQYHYRYYYIFPYQYPYRYHYYRYPHRYPYRYPCPYPYRYLYRNYYNWGTIYFLDP